jgi:phosphatidate cytidylyltransferase
VLSRRLLSAAILIAVSLGLIYLDLKDDVRGQAGLWTVPLLIFFSLGTVWEFSTLLKLKWPIQPGMVTWHALISVAVALFPLWYSLMTHEDYPADCAVGRLGWIWIGVMAGVGLGGAHALSVFGRCSVSSSVDASEEEKKRDHERTTLGWLLSSVVICYVVGGLSLWHVIRMRGQESGLYELIALVAVTKFADTGAYFSGKLFGRTKLAPAISPGKTVEGLIGGLVFSIVVAYVAFRVVLPRLGVAAGPYIWGPALLGTMLTVIGLIGDLLESMVKRSVGAKDSGNSLPGLGGVWDVTDSLIPASIVGYLGLIARL